MRPGIFGCISHEALRSQDKGEGQIDRQSTRESRRGKLRRVGEFSSESERGSKVNGLVGRQWERERSQKATLVAFYGFRVAA
jgi:hypothetical protein